MEIQLKRATVAVSLETMRRNRLLVVSLEIQVQVRLAVASLAMPIIKIRPIHPSALVILPIIQLVSPFENQ